ncbi:uncharacterized protein LOC115322985 [Ixodes scapularis]|uniref:uncharacterized protein LOC115322985 n=1 Tax=Ixodes scapularis TaxID=6945 RepID=UPI001C38311F|nr:uncharacterized protein LOC115322985 [Ixodes scapularis]
MANSKPKKRYFQGSVAEGDMAKGGEEERPAQVACPLPPNVQHPPGAMPVRRTRAKSGVDTARDLLSIQQDQLAVQRELLATQQGLLATQQQQLAVQQEMLLVQREAVDALRRLASIFEQSVDTGVLPSDRKISCRGTSSSKCAPVVRTDFASASARRCAESPSASRIKLGYMLRPHGGCMEQEEKEWRGVRGKSTGRRWPPGGEIHKCSSLASWILVKFILVYIFHDFLNRKLGLDFL